MRKLSGIALVALVAVALAAGALADLRQGNVREKGTCAIPAYDCVYTQSGWHKAYGTWWVSDYQWSDGMASQYFANTFALCCDSLIYDIYIGGGFQYFEGQEVPETLTVDFLMVEADPFFREVSACCWPDPFQLVARYTFNVTDFWPAAYSGVYGCTYGDYEKVKLSLDMPLRLDADCNYFICYYANADKQHTFNGTMDMLCGRDRMCITWDAGRSWDCWYWQGGDIAAGMDFEFRGELLDCSCICDVCAESGWDILYDQTAKHVFTEGSLWGGLSYGGGESTYIMGQSFNYQWDGCVKCIGVGGVFGGWNGEYEIPEHLVVELWCQEQQGGWAEPVTLLRRWMVPVEELYLTQDPEGYELYNFFTEDYPGPYTWCDTTAPGGSVWATDDRPYLLVAYSDGDANAPFMWFIDMCKGNCMFSASQDCGFTWPYHYNWWGEPMNGNPEANFSFVLCGGCAEVCAPVEGDEVVDSGYLAGPLFGQPQGGFPGWVWFSIPVDPADCCDEADCYDPNTLLGFDAGGKLFYWDKYGKFTQVYKPPFVTWPFEVGAGYLFFMDAAVPNPIYGGINPYVSSRLAGGEPRFFGYDYGYQLGRQGWTWVGLPGNEPIYGGGLGSDFGNKVRVVYPAHPDWAGGSGIARTAGEDQNMTPDNWVDWGWAYYDTFLQAPKTFKFSAPFGNKHCFPWIGYRAWIKVGTADGPYDPTTGDNWDQVVLIWPAPECHEGTFPPQ